MNSLSKIWNSKTVDQKTKVQLFEALILSVLLYNCENWALNAKLKKKIRGFYGKQYKRITKVHREKELVKQGVKEEKIEEMLERVNIKMEMAKCKK